MRSNIDIAIIGGGAAGLMAAIAAAGAGCRSVAIFERNRACGAKILMAGGGRCNLTNTDCSSERYFGGSRPFVRNVLAAFDNADAMHFFESIGVPLAIEAEGRVFPASGNAREVLEALLRRASELGVDIRTEIRVRSIRRAAGGFSISMPPHEAAARKLVLATGGRAHPKSGSDGSGLVLAHEMGHAIVPPVPALAPLALAELWTHRLAGLTVDAHLQILAGEKPIAEATGSIVFTHAGISGPAALNVSREVARRSGQRLALRLALFPSQQSQELREGLAAFRGERPTALLISFFRKLLPDRLCESLLRHAGQHPGTRLRDCSSAELARAVAAFTAARLTVKGTGGFEEAHVTAGGVALNEVRYQTMGSRIVPGLFFAGEILDVDGESGGMNLQWAWSSGALAGRAAATAA
jgi:predicted Rossmann fold flavoprotein